MRLAAILDALGFSRMELWGDDELTRMSARRDRLQRHLSRRQGRLIRQRRIIEGIREALKADERRVVHRSPADLHEMLRSVEANRARLRDCELTYQETLTQFRAIQRRLADVQRRIRTMELVTNSLVGRPS